MTTSEPIRVLVVEDHHVVRQGLVALLNVAEGLEVVAEAADGVEAIAQFRKHQPAVTLVNPSNHWADDQSGIRFSPLHLRTLAPAGRLDIDSTGLLVLTQDGRVAKQLIGGHSDVDKEYLVRVKFGEHEVRSEERRVGKECQ